MNLTDFLLLQKGAKKNGKGYKVLCPGHDDHDSSLSVTERKDGRGIAIFCQAGCETEHVLRHMGLTFADLLYDHAKDDGWQKDNNKPKKERWQWIWEDQCRELTKDMAEAWLVQRRQFPEETAKMLAEEVSSLCKLNTYKGENKVVVPVFNYITDEMVGIQAIGKEDKRTHGTVKGTVILGQKREEDENIVFVESYANAVALRAAGLTSIVLYSTSNVKSGLQKILSRMTMDDRKLGIKRNYYLWLDRGVEKIQQTACIKNHILGIFFNESRQNGYDINDVLVEAGNTERFQEYVVRKINDARQTCPWMSEAAEPNPNQDRESEEGLPIIYVEGGALPRMVDQAEDALLNTHPFAIFQRGGVLVQAVKEAEPPKGIVRDPGAVVISTVNKHLLIDYFTQVAAWKKFNNRGGFYNPVDCPASVAEIYLSRQRWKLNVLTEIIETPTLRPDGTILDQEGYDAETGFLFLNNAGTDFPQVDEDVSREDAIEALDEIKSLLRDFPFVADEDRSVAICAILTAVVRPSLPTAPLFCFSAPKMGSGKTLLADIVALISTGKNSTKISQAQNPEEEEKRLHAALIEGTPNLCIDNIDAPLGGAPLCSILSGTEWSCRILGESRNVRVTPRVTFMATGNNLMLMGDITTRAIMCNLDPQCEHPEEREFDGDIRKYVKEKRGELVHACLTILRAYHVANKPKQNISVMGRFEEWSDVVRSAIIWAGEPDPCRSRREIEKNDPDREKLVGLLSAWHDVFGEKEITMKNIKEVLGDWHDNSQKEKLEDAIIPIAGSKNFIDYRKLGYYLKANKNRIEGGYQLQETGKRSKKGYLWKVSWVFLWEKAEKVKDLASEFISEKDIDKKIGTDKLEPEDHKKFWNIMSKVIG